MALDNPLDQTLDANGALTEGRRPRGRVVRSPLELGLRTLNAGPLFIVVALIVAMSLLSPYFLTERNLQNLSAQTSIIAALAIGQFFVILLRGVDISVGSTVGLVGVVGATAATWSWTSGWSVVVVMLFAGALVGVVNGGFIVKGRLPQPLIVTLATLGIVRGLALVISDGDTLVTIPPLVDTIGNGFVGPIPVPALIVGVVAVLAWGFATRTQWGRWIYAVGGDPQAASRLGIPAARVELSCYVFCGLMAALAGLIIAGRTHAGTAASGSLLELDAITAAIIGGVSLAGGRGNVANMVAGALVLGVIRNGLDLLDVSPFWQIIAIGCIVIVALELDVLRRALENKLRVRRAEQHSIGAHGTGSA